MQQNTGLSSGAVLASRSEYGQNSLSAPGASRLRTLGRQLTNPLLLVLIITVAILYEIGDRIDAVIVAMIALLSVGLSYFNEYSAERAVDEMISQFSMTALVMRQGKKQSVPVEDMVVGDTAVLYRGCIVAADIKITDCNDLIVDESTYTGEPVPIHKALGSTVLMGSTVTSGEAMGLVTSVGQMTEYAKLSKKPKLAPTKTKFQQGLSQLNLLITRIALVTTVVICSLNIALGREPFLAVLFSISIAIAVTPALLPVITTLCLAKGAKRMSGKGVIVKNLAAIEDLSTVRILCIDKNGVLTDGNVKMLESINMRGLHDSYVLEAALICSTISEKYRSIGNPLDVALWKYAQEHGVQTLHGIKCEEHEFSYEHRFQFSVIEQSGERLLVAQGASDRMIEVCSTYRNAGGHLVPMANHRKAFKAELDALNAEGLRLLAVGQRAVSNKDSYDFSDAEGMELLGYLTFLDTPMPSAMKAISQLRHSGVEVKIITNDNEIVTQHVAQEIGFTITSMVTGPALERMELEERERAVLHSNVFARITPEQKIQIIRDFQRAGSVVGCVGNHIDDIQALQAADVGMSSSTSVDVVKDAASIILLHHGLGVVAAGVVQSRRIFANTVKYILMSSSSNFGNMFSIAGASFLLPFLPLTLIQLLFNNLLYDTSQLGLTDDEVDDEKLRLPNTFAISLLYRYVLFLAPISILFDGISFGLLYAAFHTTGNYQQRFQTGWFLESIITQVLVVFIIRTIRIPFWRSRPSVGLILLCVGVIAVAVGAPYVTIAERVLGFVAPPIWLIEALTILVASYLLLVEMVKRRFLSTLV